ncbi:MAG: DNA-directed RNA polymerase subunit beta' [Pseudomonadota bacterium]
MPQFSPRTSSASQIIADLAQPPRIAALSPIAARFVYSLRLIALHEKVGRDPVPELASRLGRVEAAAKSLAFAKTIMRVWPENIHVSRFCCGLMSHDEATIGWLVEAVVERNRGAFDATIQGLIRPDRSQNLWDAAHDLAVAELSSA